MAVRIEFPLLIYFSPNTMIRFKKTKKGFYTYKISDFSRKQVKHDIGSTTEMAKGFFI